MECASARVLQRGPARAARACGQTSAIKKPGRVGTGLNCGSCLVPSFAMCRAFACIYVLAACLPACQLACLRWVLITIWEIVRKGPWLMYGSLKIHSAGCWLL